MEFDNSFPEMMAGLHLVKGVSPVFHREFPVDDGVQFMLCYSAVNIRKYIAVASIVP
jgi:hypothetical protein